MADYKKTEIERIDERIDELTNHMVMVGRAGRQPNSSMEELHRLKLRKNDLLNGTNELEIYELEKRLHFLEGAKKEASIFKKSRYNSEINELKQKIEMLKNGEQKVKPKTR